MRLLGRIGAVASVVAFVSSEAPAQADPKGFGDKGQLILSADRLVPLFAYSRFSTTTTNNNVDLTNSVTGSGISLLFGRDFSVGGQINPHALPRIAFDYAVIQNLTIGGALAFGFGLGGTAASEVNQGALVVNREQDAPKATAIGIAPRVGYVLGLSDLFAFWPRVGFSAYWVSSTSEDTRNNATTTISVTQRQFSVDLDPQFVIVPTEHLFFHAGPLVAIPFGGSVSTETSQGPNTTTVEHDSAVFHLGLSAGLGGYFNL